MHGTEPVAHTPAGRNVGKCVLLQAAALCNVAIVVPCGIDYLVHAAFDGFRISTKFCNQVAQLNADRIRSITHTRELLYHNLSGTYDVQLALQNGCGLGNDGLGNDVQRNVKRNLLAVELQFNGSRCFLLGFHYSRHLTNVEGKGVGVSVNIRDGIEHGVVAVAHVCTFSVHPEAVGISRGI